MPQSHSEAADMLVTGAAFARSLMLALVDQLAGVIAGSRTT